MSLAENCPEVDLKELFKKFVADELRHKKILMDKHKGFKNLLLFQWIIKLTKLFLIKQRIVSFLFNV